jgi:hypothetical protein
LSRAYGLGAELLSGYSSVDTVASAFMDGYIEHTQETVKLQSRIKKTVFSSTDHAELQQEVYSSDTKN